MQNNYLRLDKINNDLIGPMQKRYDALDEEIPFFEEAVRGLPDKLKKIMNALYVERVSWEEVEYCFDISRRTISRYRKIAIDNLVLMYQRRAAIIEKNILS